MAELWREQAELIEEGQRLDREALAARIIAEMQDVHAAGVAVALHDENGQVVEMAEWGDAVRRLLDAGRPVTVRRMAMRRSCRPSERSRGTFPLPPGRRGKCRRRTGPVARVVGA